MQIIERNVTELHPYVNNPRKNADAVAKVAASIRSFGFKVPIVIDSSNNIVCGHTRLLAALELGLKTVPCVVADDLTEDQIKAFRLADNKVAEFAQWDADPLLEEMQGIDEIDMSEFGFDMSAFAEPEEDWFENRKRYDNEGVSEESEEYQEFVEKFEQKRTTDDCYTPDNIYEVVAEWVAKTYKIDRERFVRPFKPNGDYQKEKYGEGAVVVDNPPFSILSEIEKWYNENGIKYFLFAPSVSCLATARRCCAVCVGAPVTYENGAIVQTSFVTNLDDAAVVTAPDLYALIYAKNKENTNSKEFPKYEYPVNVVTAAKMSYLSKYGQYFRIEQKDATEKIVMLDAQRESGKEIFGGGLLISEKAAAEKAAAEKAAAEKWELSEREKEIVRSLGG